MTVVVPSFDHADFVEAAIASALGQTERDFEVLVIDDGSRDDTRARLARLSDPRLRIRLQENRGLSRTLNRGLAEAQGPWIKFLPSDDLLELDCLARQLAAVDADPSLGVVFSLPTIVDAGNHPLEDPAPQAWFDVPLREHAELLSGLVERNFLSAPGALFSRELALAVGGFDPSLVVAQDYDLWLRMLSRASARLVPERLVRVRWHGANQSARSTEATEAERAHALVSALSAAGLPAWVDWVAKARGEDEATARVSLAAALLRSGLAEVRPFARRLLGEARALGAGPPTDPVFAPLRATAPELDRPGGWGDPSEFERAEASGEAEEDDSAGEPAPVPWSEPFAADARPRPGRRLRDAWREIRRVVSRRGRPGDLTKGSRPAPAPEPGPRPIHWVVLAVVPLDDSGGGQRSAQLARALARSGARVTYAARFPRGESIDVAVEEPVPAPVAIEWDLSRIRRIVADDDARVRVLAELPEAQIVGLAREVGALGVRVLYDKVDAWDRATFATWYSRGDEEALVAVADDLIGTARPLVRSLATSKRPVHYLPNAVDAAVFRPLPKDAERPADAPAGDVTLVYAGALWGEWFDWELVAVMARERPRWTLLLIGDPPPAPPALPPNVHLLGLKPQRALPPYLAVADVCLIPFRRSPLTEAVSPLKLFEYLAMQRPVVAPRLGEVADAPYVFFAEKPAEAIAAVETAVATPAPIAEIDRFVARHTWDARASSLSALTERPRVAVIVLRRGSPVAVDACLDALLAARGELGYRVALVDDGSEGPETDRLLAREESGEILLLRSARRGAAASRNLGIRATRSEIVVFLDVRQRVRAPGWLDAALGLLLDDRRIGAVGAIEGDLATRGGRVESSGPGPVAAAALGAAGLVVPRAVLTRIQGFDERYDPQGCDGLDLSFQIREAGYALARIPELAHALLTPDAPSPPGEGPLGARNLRRLRAKWRSRPDYFAASRIPAAAPKAV